MPVDATARMRHQRQTDASFQSLRIGRGTSRSNMEFLLSGDRHLDLIKVRFIYRELDAASALLPGLDQDIGNAFFKGSDHGAYTAGSLQNLCALHGFEQDHVVDAALVEIETVTLYDINYLDDRYPGKIEPLKWIKNEHLINSAQHLSRETSFLEHVVNRSQELIAVGDLPSQFANPVGIVTLTRS